MQSQKPKSKNNDADHDDFDEFVEAAPISSIRDAEDSR